MSASVGGVVCKSLSLDESRQFELQSLSGLYRELVVSEVKNKKLTEQLMRVIMVIRLASQSRIKESIQTDRCSQTEEMKAVKVGIWGKF